MLLIIYSGTSSKSINVYVTNAGAGTISMFVDNILGGTTSLTASNWHYLALEYDMSGTTWTATLYVDGVVLSMTLGKMDTSPDRHRICCLGLADGRLLVSFLPFPTHMINASLFNPYLALAAVGTSQARGNDTISLVSSSIDLNEATAGSSTARGGEDAFPMHSVLDGTGTHVGAGAGTGSESVQSRTMNMNHMIQNI